MRDEQVAVKAETDFGQKNSALRAEAEILISLQGGPGVPDVYWVGKRDLAAQACNILVMELLGPDMEDLLEMMNRRTVSEKTGLMLAWQFIDCLEHIHSRGLIHRDIKPENFLMGVKERANKVCPARTPTHCNALQHTAKHRNTHTIFFW